MSGSQMPEISVVVPSHDRPLRLRWLLNALEEQDLERERWEVIVGHDSTGPETEELLRTHPLAAAGVLRHVTNEPGTCPPGANRNSAVRIARAPVIAFTDDDCRPPSDWLRKALEAARRHPDAIIQGATRPDPDEMSIGSAPYYHSQSIVPPRPWAQACNIIYPRELLEYVGGFDETTYTGEDTDLAMRCREIGAEYLGDPSFVTCHAVTETTLRATLRGLWRWQDLPALIKRHPQLRDEFQLWIFWKWIHVWFPLALLSLLLGRRRRWSLLLAVPWAVQSLPKYGTDPRGRFRTMAELPARAAMDATEFAALTKGSIKHRTLFL
jgi:GT2 family glycosyltransferase